MSKHQPNAYLTEDMRGCIRRALQLRRSILRQEATRYEILISQDDQPAKAALQIVKQELDYISVSMRQLWVVYKR